MKKNQPNKGFIGELGAIPQARTILRKQGAKFDYEKPVVQPAPTEDMNTHRRLQRNLAAPAPKSNIADEYRAFVANGRKVPDESR